MNKLLAKSSTEYIFENLETGYYIVQSVKPSFDKPDVYIEISKRPLFPIAACAKYDFEVVDDVRYKEIAKEYG